MLSNPLMKAGATGAIILLCFLYGKDFVLGALEAVTLFLPAR